MHSNYHTTPGSYIHQMEIVENGKMAILAGVGPMGLAAINYTVNREDRKPSLLVVTDIDQTRLDRAAGLYTVAYAASKGIDLRYINTSKLSNPIEDMKAMTGGEGFNDVFVFAPVAPVIEQADGLLAFDGCLNFFAGPSDPNLQAKLNFYNVHYGYTHIAGTSGGNTDDMKEALRMMAKGLDPAGLVTHIGGINAVIEATLHLPNIPGGKKLIYNHLEMPLTPITDFAEKGKTNPVYAKLDAICNKYKGLWSVEAETYLLKNAEGLN
jgi:L-sorbose 1-phosphate reductase